MLSSTANEAQIVAVNAAGLAGSVDSADTESCTSEPGTTGPDTPDPDTNGTATNDPVIPETVSNPPFIGGSLVCSVTADTTYTFQPVAGDADGEGLSLSITGMPAWAGFDTSTGRLSGTPTDSDAATYGDIAIVVSDGTDTAPLPAFDITVTPMPVTAGSFSQAWTSAVARADGSSLSLADIGGYRIHYGSATGSYPILSR